MSEQTNQTIRVQLNYPLDQVNEPILYRLIVDYGWFLTAAPTLTSARAAFWLWNSVAKYALECGLDWLEARGITVTEVGLDGKRDWAV